MTQSEAPAARTPTSPVSVIVLGTSAGGMRALTTVLQVLPPTFDVPVVVAQHLDRDHPSRLGDLLGRRVPLPVREVGSGARLSPGTVHVAPAGHDVSLAADGRMGLAPCAEVPFACPSIDQLFMSAATAFGPGAVAVVLTGTGRDGAQGVVAVTEAGGTVIVEDDRTARFGGMPRAATQTGRVDLALPVGAIGRALLDLSRQGRVA